MSQGETYEKGDQLVIVYIEGDANQPFILGKIDFAKKYDVQGEHGERWTAYALANVAAAEGVDVIVSQVCGDTTYPVILQLLGKHYFDIALTRYNLKLLTVPGEGLTVGEDAVVAFIEGDVNRPVVLAKPFGYLYAGVSNPGRVYRYLGGAVWELISPDLDYSVNCLCEYNNQLYAGTQTTIDVDLGVGRVYRWDGGLTWTKVGDNMEDCVNALEVHDGKLYAGTTWAVGSYARLWRYDGGVSWTSFLAASDFTGFRSLLSWSLSERLQLGDAGWDVFGRFDGSQITVDENHGGSCVYDFQVFNGKLYSSNYHGKVFQSPNGINWTEKRGNVSPYRETWECEEFNAQLYFSLSEILQRYNESDNTFTDIWSLPGGGSDQAIIAMEAMPDGLYLGVGGEAPYWEATSGIARVYRYTGAGDPKLISGDLGRGVQVLYAPRTLTGGT